MTETIIGLDIGGTKTAVVEGSCDGEILTKRQAPTAPHEGFEAVFVRICALVSEALADSAQSGREPAALSVSIGGPLDIARGIIYSPPHLPGWDAIPLRDLLMERFKLPTFVEHDGNAGAIAEWRFGAGRGTHNLIFLTMGTGLGGGFILNDRVYRGATDLAGEVGHMRIARTGPLVYGKRGSWEGYCAGPAFAWMAQRMYPADWGRGITTPEVVRLALAGDQRALAVVQRVGAYFGRGLAVLADIINPEMIVVGSMGVRLGELLLAPARRAMRQEALPGTFSACSLVPAALGDKIGDIAALCAALEGLRSG
ncbi:MAG: ROK family protein [Chloroflexi bacterium]|nr:ROK family protein [Chloroflexota bacterium]